MQSQVVDAPQASRFEIRVGEQLAGFVTYRRSGSTWSLLHTEIRPEFEGQGIGSALARGVLDAARDDGAAVLPFCPFLRSYVQRHPEHVPLVPPERREEFGLTV